MDQTLPEPARRNPGLFLLGMIGTFALHAGVLGFLWLQKNQVDHKPILGPGTFVDATLVKFGKPRDLKFLPHKEGVIKTSGPPPELKVATSADALPRPPEDKKKVEPDKIDPLKKTHADLFKKLNDDRPEAVVEEGGSLTGSRAGTSETASGDPYILMLIDRIGSSWTIPTTIPVAVAAKLTAVVCFNIAPSGQLKKYVIEKSSGNSQFDSSLEGVLGTIKEFPPPPPRWTNKTFCPELGAPQTAPQIRR